MESEAAGPRGNQDGALEVIAGIGRNMLANGAGASEAAAAMREAARRARLRDFDVIIRYGEFSLAYRDDSGAQHLSARTIPVYGFNYGSLTTTTRVATRFCEGGMTLVEAAAELDAIGSAAPRYPQWLILLAAGGAGAAAAMLYGGDWLVIAVSLLANILLYWGSGRLAEWPVFFLQAASGAYAVMAAALVHFLHPGVEPSRVIISVILVMLAGMTSTAAVQDMVSGWYVAASGRLLDGLMKTLGLVVGIKAGLFVAARLRWELPVSADFTMSDFSLPVMLAAAAFIAVGFSVVTQLEPRIVGAAACLSVITFWVFSVAAPWGDAWSRAAAGLAAGVLTTPCSVIFKASANIFAFCAILALLPGVMLYQGLWAPDPVTSLGLLAGAIGAASSIVCGLMIGEYVMAAAFARFGSRKPSLFAPRFAQPSEGGNTNIPPAARTPPGAPRDDHPPRS